MIHIEDDIVIVAIEGIAALGFLIAFYFAFQIHQKTKKTTNIWMFVSLASLIAFFTSGLNALEWFYDESPKLDKAGEYLSIAFSIIWIYIAYQFISLKNKVQKREKTI